MPVDGERGASAELVCPRCGRRHEADERLCRSCRMPLVPASGAEEHPLSAGHEEARKIDPRYSHGPLVRVAIGRHQAEAELIKGMLLESGIPSMLRRTGGFDVPDFLAAGPRDVLVPESAEGAARELLSEVEGPDGPPDAAMQDAGHRDRLRPGRTVKVAALLLAAILFFGGAAGAIWWWLP